MALQAAAIAAAQAGHGGLLAECFAKGANLTPEVEMASRHNPTVEVNQALLSQGWPKHGALSQYLTQDVGKGAELVQWYLDRGALHSPQLYSKAGQHADVQTVQLLRAHFQRPFTGSGALQAAAWDGKVAVVQWLLDQGEENVNTWPDEDPVYGTRECMNATPLHRAVSQGRLDVTELLLSRGADPRVRDQMGRSSTDIARRYGAARASILKVLEGATERNS